LCAVCGAQHYVKNLGDRVVSYLNVDMAIEGQVALRARALPIMHHFVYDVATRVCIQPSLCTPSVTFIFR